MPFLSIFKSLTPLQKGMSIAIVVLAGLLAVSYGRVECLLKRTGAQQQQLDASHRENEQLNHIRDVDNNSQVWLESLNEKSRKQNHETMSTVVDDYAATIATENKQARDERRGKKHSENRTPDRVSRLHDGLWRVYCGGNTESDCTTR